MLIQKQAKCIKCGSVFNIAYPYGVYHCSRCNKFLGCICDACLATTRCSCGGQLIDKTGECTANNGIIF